MASLFRLLIVATLSLASAPLMAAEEEITTTTSVTKTTTTDTGDVSSTTVTTAKKTVSDDDLKIEASIKEKIAKSSVLTGTELEVVSEGGVVRITGVVTTQSQADEVVSLAKKTVGVTEVISDFTIKTKTNPK